MPVQTFRMLDMPPELRNNIYNYVFESPVHGYGIDDVNSTNCIDLLRARKYMPGTALLLTCRQVREEAHKLHKLAFGTAFFSQNRLYIDVWGKRRSGTPLREIDTELDKLPPEVRVRDLSVEPWWRSSAGLRFTMLDGMDSFSVLATDPNLDTDNPHHYSYYDRMVRTHLRCKAATDKSAALGFDVADLQYILHSIVDYDTIWR